MSLHKLPEIKLPKRRKRRVKVRPAEEVALVRRESAAKATEVMRHVRGLSPRDRMIARVWAGGGFKSVQELANHFGMSRMQMSRIMNGAKFSDAVDAYVANGAQAIKPLVDEVCEHAEKALELYGLILENDEYGGRPITLSMKRGAAKEIVEWSIRLKGLGGGGEDQHARKIINQQINIESASEDDLRRIIGEHTGIVKK